MNQEKRLKNIDIAQKDEPVTHKEIMWKGSLKNMPVHNIKLDYLIYNKYNGRILSATKSYEATGKDINPANEEGKKILEKFLWESKRERNNITLRDLKKKGQIESGIVTADGIIIDGNRRAMLLNKLNHGYFKAVILPVKLGEDPSEIHKLETSYQMGADQKLDYNPIEKYLKAQDLVDEGFSEAEIAEMMGENITKIKEYIEVLEIMNDYLNYLGYDNYYTQLDKTEDSFLTLNSWLKNYYGGQSIIPFDGYNDLDVNDLKIIMYDYIRARYEGKDLRKIAHRSKSNNFFGDKNLWESFTKEHFKYITPILEGEEPPNFESSNVTKMLASRDKKYRELSLDYLKKNLENHDINLRNKQYKDKPVELLERTINTLKNIDINNKNTKSNDFKDKAGKLVDIFNEVILDNSIKTKLDYIYKLLSDIDTNKIDNDKNDLADLLTKIRKKAYELEKRI